MLKIFNNQRLKCRGLLFPPISCALYCALFSTPNLNKYTNVYQFGSAITLHYITLQLFVEKENERGKAQRKLDIGNFD